MRKYMQSALNEALAAYDEAEVPVGAIILQNTQDDKKIIAAAHNMCKNKKNGLYHAEMIAIDSACRTLQRADLRDCELYVTLEPCPMCAAAIIHSGISKVVFGAYDTDFGALGSYLNLANHSYAKHLEVYGGICERECRDLIKKFFEEIRSYED